MAVKFWFGCMAGFVLALFVIGETIPMPKDVCAAVYRVDKATVEFHDDKCWLKQQTPLEVPKP